MQTVSAGEVGVVLSWSSNSGPEMMELAFCGERASSSGQSSTLKPAIL